MKTRTGGIPFDQQGDGRKSGAQRTKPTAATTALITRSHTEWREPRPSSGAKIK